jgi:membrane protein
MKIIASIIKSFWDDDCFNYAENIAFCTMLAIIPNVMVMVSIAGFFLGQSHDALMSIVEMATDVLPIGRDVIISNMQSILDKRSSLSIFGIVFLLFISTLLVASIERALNIIFKSTGKRNFFHSRLLGVAVIAWITFLFSLPTMVQILEGLLNRYGFGFPLGWFMTGKSYFFLVAFLAYAMVMVIIPNKKVYIRYAAVGAVMFSMGISIARFIFQWYMHFALHRYDIVYGSLAAVIVLIVWIYYLSVVLLFSAEAVATMQERRCLHRRAARGGPEPKAGDDAGGDEAQ